MKTTQVDVGTGLLKRRDAARFLQISERNVDALTKRGDLRSVVIGLRSRRWPLAEIQQYIAAQLAR